MNSSLHGKYFIDPENCGVKAPSIENALDTLVETHPRIVASAGDFERVKKVIASDSFAAKWYEELKAHADEIIDQPVTEYEIYDGRRLLRRCRAVLDRVSTLAMAYRVDGDKKYLDRAWKELHAAGNFKNWNPGHFLDTGEMCLAMAIGYDWLYDDFSEQQREFIASAIRDKALKVVLDIGYGNGYAWFAARTNNWNQVCNGGLLAGALAIADREPEIAARIVHNSVKSLPVGATQYYPDGGCEEGTGYWNYGASFNVVAISVLESALGASFGLADIKGFDKAVYFPVYMSSPSKTTFVFSDGSVGIANSPAMPWFAKRFDCPLAADHFRTVMPLKGMRTGRLNALALLWYDPEVTVPDGFVPEPTNVIFRKVECGTLRENFTDPNGMFMGFKGGRPSVSHGHIDSGSFIFDALGERWAMDLGAENYNIPDYWALHKNGGRWKYYRMRAEGHNTLVINPAGQNDDQNVDAVSEIVSFDPTPSHSKAVVDLTPAYEGFGTEKVLRTFEIVSSSADRYAVITDEITPDGSKPADILWFMHTKAEIEISPDGKTSILSIDDKKLKIELVAPLSASFEVMDAVALPMSPNPPESNPNKGVKKLVVHLKGVSNATQIIVKLIPRYSQD